MIKRYTVYLKNIIFFKVIMVSFVILLLIWLMFIFKEDLVYSTNRYNFIHTNTSDIEKKLHTVVNAKNELLNTYKKYEKSLNTSAQENCSKRQELINEIKQLGAKYTLNDPIDVNIIRSFKNRSNNYVAQQININNYDCNITFAAPDFVTFINLIKEIYALMPQNSFISFLGAQELGTLTPSIIAKLNTKKEPDLIAVKLRIRLREITQSS